MDNQGKELRLTFVGMLFALAIGKLAIDVGEYYLTRPPLLLNLHVLSHFVLSMYILTSSWIGGQMSKSSGSAKKIKSVFDLQYVILLIDVLLVIFYFIIILGVEKQPEFVPDASVESFWTLIIFVTYLVWDIFTKLLSSEIVERTDQNKDKHSIKRLKWNIKEFIARASITFICILLASLVYCVMGNSTTTEEVIIADIALLSLFVLFRGFKDTSDRVDNNKVDQGLFYRYRVWVSRYLPSMIFGICFIVYLFLI